MSFCLHFSKSMKYDSPNIPGSLSVLNNGPQGKCLCLTREKGCNQSPGERGMGPEVHFFFTTCSNSAKDVRIHCLVKGRKKKEVSKDGEKS